MVPMPLQRGASALIRYELRKWLNNKAVAPHAMKIKRTLPQDQPRLYDKGLDQAKDEGGTSAYAAGRGEHPRDSYEKEDAATAKPSGSPSSAAGGDGYAPHPPPPPRHRI